MVDKKNSCYLKNSYSTGDAYRKDFYARRAEYLQASVQDLTVPRPDEFAMEEAMRRHLPATDIVKAQSDPKTYPMFRSKFLRKIGYYPKVKVEIVNEFSYNPVSLQVELDDYEPLYECEKKGDLIDKNSNDICIPHREDAYFKFRPCKVKVAYCKMLNDGENDELYPVGEDGRRPDRPGGGAFIPDSAVKLTFEKVLMNKWKSPSDDHDFNYGEDIFMPYHFDPHFDPNATICVKAIVQTHQRLGYPQLPKAMPDYKDKQYDQFAISRNGCDKYGQPIEPRDKRMKLAKSENKYRARDVYERVKLLGAVIEGIDDIDKQALQCAKYSTFLKLSGWRSITMYNRIFEIEF